MNREEVKKVLSIINVAYPNFYKNSDKNAAVNLWELMFEEDDIQNVLLAVKAHIATNVFAPTIANIRESMTKVNNKSVSAEEAWGLVKKSISRYGMYREEEAKASLPKELAEFMNRFGYKDLCLSENTMADRAHFIKLWETSNKKSHYNAMLPKGLALQIETRQLQNVSDILKLEG